MNTVVTPNLIYNPDVPDLRLKDLLALWSSDIMKRMNCHAIATIQSFTNGAGAPGSATPARVTATINYQKTTWTPNAAGQIIASLQEYPTLIDCPAIILGGGGAKLTFPIAKGDECLIMFNDRDFDNWYQGGINQGVPTARTHSFSDGVALVGLYNTNRAFSSYDSVRAVLSGTGSAYVGVGPALIKLANQTTTLNTLLQALVTAIKGLSIDVAGVGPAQGTVDATSVLALSNLATQISGLLE